MEISMLRVLNQEAEDEINNGCRVKALIVAISQVCVFRFIINSCRHQYKY